MSDFNYDAFASNGDHVKWTNVGDTVAGEVLAVRVGKDFNGNDCPELVIVTDNGEAIVTAGQKVLQNRLADVKPRVGERVAITYSAVGEAKPGKAPAKLFTVAVRDAQGALRQSPEGEVDAPAAPVAPAASAAATQLI